ncbi:hypothetical protein JOF46_004445 [Paeniglutamicibacter psychrophenolicus]|uniref:C2H2-type domain-containing protein n=1 Tax=Paeniglutamicibacter psychrophenolicus TaxID=257454 RepID=A0ABS4WJU5_9MICC|nr:hypothetical protein [Paeniglutamicibacter psychrophenolicus]
MADTVGCSTCGAQTLQNDKGKHSRWHEKIDRDIVEARQADEY